MMKLGIIENWDENGFRHAKALGLDAVEFTYNGGNDPDKLLEMVPDIRTWTIRYEIEVGSIGRWGENKFDNDGNLIEAVLQDNLKLIDVCAALECPVFVTGVNWVDGKSFEENCANAVAYLTRVNDYAKEKGVKVAVYNCDWSNFVRDPRTWAEVLTRVPGVGIKYDPSHCINVGSGRYLEEIAAWGDKIYHFHIKGTLNVDGEHVDDPPAGLDMINWRAVMGLLYAKRYDGMLSIEPHSHTWTDDLGEWGIRLTAAYIKPMVYGG